jgi:uncharacterized membrane protein (DUF373 family)
VPGPENQKREKMSRTQLKDRIIWTIEFAVVTALQVFTIIVVVVATFNLYILLSGSLFAEIRHVESIESLLPAMQRSFAGVLVVVLGLELLETLKAYFSEHQIRLEVILIVAIIAVSRHVIEIDWEHSSGMALFGLSSVILGLTLSYFLAKRARILAPSRRPDREGSEGGR